MRSDGTIRSRDDDQEFMQDLYHSYQRLMYYMVQKYIASPTEREDIVQDCLEKLITKVDILKGAPPPVLARYISVTVRNTAISFLKRRGRESAAVVSLEDVEEGAAAERGSPLERDILRREEIQEFRTIWKQLDEETKMALEGRYILGYDDKELAELLDCKPDSVRMKLTRARRKAKMLMKGGNGHDRS